jgi:hypothetical protein
MSCNCKKRNDQPDVRPVGQPPVVIPPQPVVTPQPKPLTQEEIDWFNNIDVVKSN